MHRHEDMNTWLLGARGRAGIRKKLGSEISQIREREIEREKTKMKHDLDDKNQKNKDGHTSHYDRIQPGRWITLHIKTSPSLSFLDEIGQFSHKLKVKREEIYVQGLSVGTEMEWHVFFMCGVIGLCIASKMSRRFAWQYFFPVFLF